ncbi:MAG: hypothetical protein HKN10_06100 [Myxococcales bacterium]|nr:hypothetical protein [Deltaproteobacteria bacterium]NNE18031.1 hypothetical protein [Myxococcales bacterium]
MDGEVAVESIWRVAEHPSDPIAVNTVVAIDSRRVLEFAADAGGFVEVGSTTIAPGIGLPPTKVYLLD